MRKADVVIIGAGISGLSLADSLVKLNSSLKIIIVEREPVVGGVLNLALDSSDNFDFQKSSVDPKELINDIKKRLEGKVEILLGTSAVSVKRNTVMVISQNSGLEDIKARCVVFSTGAVEKTQGVLNIPGFRPSGILTAGTVQYEVSNGEKFENIKNVVVYGISPSSIAVIRLLSKLGKKITIIQQECNELENELKENADLVLQSFKIIDIDGKDRITSIKATECDSISCSIEVKSIDCQMLVLGCGYLPFIPLLIDLKIKINPETRGPVFNKDNFYTNKSGIFAAGDALYIHKSVEEICQQNEKISHSINEYVSEKKNKMKLINSLLRGKRE